MMPSNEESMASATARNAKNNAEHLIQNHPKRLAKKSTEQYKSPAAYVIVVRNNNNSKSGRSRRKRSTEYATLEPIDENSLTALRKVYKNSLREITLKPNETPGEALMRYNNEAIRDALEKANKQPMEIAAGEEDVEVKENKAVNETEQSLQHTETEQISKQLPVVYSLNDNGQIATKTPTTNGRYIILPSTRQQIQPVSASFNPQQTVVYDSPSNTDNIYNNMISKYNTAAVYDNPFASVYNPVETSPYIDEYSVANHPYQLADVAEQATKYIVYQKSDAQPYFIHNDFLSPPTNINNNLQHFSASGHYDKTKMLEYNDFVRELPPIYSHMLQPPIELTNSYRFGRSQERYSLENIIAVIKDQLIKCCNACKNNILKGLDETLKHQNYRDKAKLVVFEKNIKPYNIFTDKPHTLTYFNPANDKDFEYKHWVAQMSEKGYDKSQLSKQHQRDYLQNGELNLHVEDDQDFAHEVEKIFFKNNQSYKRETTISQTDVQTDKEAQLVTAPIDNEPKIENFKHHEELERQEADEMKTELNKAEREAKEQTNNEVIDKKLTKKITKEIEIEEKNHTTVKKESKEGNEKTQILNANKTIEPAESTNHSVYALRGQFRANKVHHPIAFTVKQGKKFANFKNINKLGSVNTLAKLNDKENVENKSDHVEEIFEILHDLSELDKEKDKKSTSMEDKSRKTMISSLYSSATYPAINTTKDSATNAIAKTPNVANIVEKPKNVMVRRSKNSCLSCSKV